MSFNEKVRKGLKPVNTTKKTGPAHKTESIFIRKMYTRKLFYHHFDNVEKSIIKQFPQYETAKILVPYSKHIQIVEEQESHDLIKLKVSNFSTISPKGKKVLLLATPYKVESGKERCFMGVTNTFHFKKRISFSEPSNI